MNNEEELRPSRRSDRPIDRDGCCDSILGSPFVSDLHGFVSKLLRRDQEGIRREAARSF